MKKEETTTPSSDGQNKNKKEKIERIPLEVNWADKFMPNTRDVICYHTSPMNPGSPDLYLFCWNKTEWEEICPVSNRIKTLSTIKNCVYQWLENYPFKKEAAKKKLLADGTLTKIANQVHVAFSSKWEKYKPQPFKGLNFLNEMLFIGDRSADWSPKHDPSFFAYETIDHRYNPNANIKDVEETLVKFLFALFGFNCESLNHIRGFSRRIIDPAPQLQTGLFLYGGPATGKTLIANLMRLLPPKSSIVKTTSALNGIFEAASLGGKRLFTIAEAQVFNLSSRILLKTWIGRDPISNRRMHDQQSVAENYNSIGVCLAYSNKTLLDLVGLDFAIFDRFITVKMDWRPYPTERSTEMVTYLAHYLSYIVNWALTAPSEIFLEQIRTNPGMVQENLNVSEMTEFLSQNVIIEENAYLPRRAFYERYSSSAPLPCNPHFNQ